MVTVKAKQVSALDLLPDIFEDEISHHGNDQLDLSHRNLLLAILNRAVLDIFDSFIHDDKTSIKDRQGSYNFFFNEHQQDHFFSFKNICLILGFNYYWFRRNLLNLYKNKYNNQTSTKNKYRYRSTFT